MAYFIENSTLSLCRTTPRRENGIPGVPVPGARVRAHTRFPRQRGPADVRAVRYHLLRPATYWHGGIVNSPVGADTAAPIREEYGPGRHARPMMCRTNKLTAFVIRRHSTPDLPAALLGSFQSYMPPDGVFAGDLRPTPWCRPLSVASAPWSGPLVGAAVWLLATRTTYNLIPGLATAVEGWCSGSLHRNW